MTDTVWMARHANRQDFVDPEWADSAPRPHDPGLSPDGIEQARQLGKRLRQESIGVLFASPFLRTAETAHHVAEALDLPIYLEPGLAEWMNPDWFSEAPERLTLSELVERFPRIDPAYESDRAPSFPETRAEAFQRAGRTTRTLIQRSTEPLLIIGHGITVSGAAQALDDTVSDLDCALCSLYRFDREADEAWQMTLCGDVSHLDEALAADRLH